MRKLPLDFFTNTIGEDHLLLEGSIQFKSNNKWTSFSVYSFSNGAIL